LLLATLVVMGSAFYAWVAMPKATLAVETFHDWIDVHLQVGILLLIGLGVHIKRRWRRIF